MDKIINKIVDFLHTITSIAFFTSIIMLILGFICTILHYMLPLLGDGMTGTRIEVLLKNGGFLFISSIFIGVIANTMETIQKKIKK